MKLHRNKIVEVLFALYAHNDHKTSVGVSSIQGTKFMSYLKFAFNRKIKI